MTSFLHIYITIIQPKNTGIYTSIQLVAIPVIFFISVTVERKKIVEIFKYCYHSINYIHYLWINDLNGVDTNKIS